jgi:hypothetical protein
VTFTLSRLIAKASDTHFPNSFASPGVLIPASPNQAYVKTPMSNPFNTPEPDVDELGFRFEARLKRLRLEGEGDACLEGGRDRGESR